MLVIYNIFNSIIEIVNLNKIVLILHNSPFVYIITLLLFCCVLLLMNVFSKYKILTTRVLFAWVISCIITPIYLVNSDIDKDKLSISINSQVILSISSFIIMLVFYLLSLIGIKPNKPKKNFGKNTWWIRIISFVVLLAFCCIFNICLFVLSALFYL